MKLLFDENAIWILQKRLERAEKDIEKLRKTDQDIFEIILEIAKTFKILGK